MFMKERRQESWSRMPPCGLAEMTFTIGVDAERFIFDRANLY